jgi:glycosyltransferase involved in cell wall biosynthesis
LNESTDAGQPADERAGPAPRRQPLTIVIASRNRAKLLNRCLDHVLAGGLGGDEIIVVDSASTNDDTARVASAHGARYVRLDQPGLSRARNVGWRSARHELVAFTDDDVRVHDGWRDAMSYALGAPHNAFVTGWIGLPPEQEGAVDPQPHIVFTEIHRFDCNSLRFYGAGANVGVRRSALCDVGGFDERLGAGTWFAGSEDSNLFGRLVAAGHFGEYRPEVRVDHDSWRSRRAWLLQQWGYGKGTGGRIRLLVDQDRGRAMHDARRALWQRGLVLAYRRMKDHWWGGVASTALHVAGTIVGFVVALPRLREPWPVHHESERRYD